MAYFLFRRRTLLFWMAPAVFFLLGRPNVKTLWPGIALVVVGECLRIWAAGYLCKYSKLITAGPFALCRNPLYIGSFLICLGYLLMCNRLDLAIVGVAAFWIFHGGAILHEERLLTERFGEEYRDYCQNVPRFIPGARRIAGEGRFSMKTLAANNEFQGAVGNILLALLFILLAYWHRSLPLNQLQASLRP